MQPNSIDLSLNRPPYCRNPPYGRGLRPTRDVTMDARSDRDGAFRFSTEDWPEQDRVEMLRDVVGRQVCRLDIEPLRDAAFRVDCTVHALPGLHIILCETGGGLPASPTREHMSDGSDALVLVMHLSARTIMSHPGPHPILTASPRCLLATSTVAAHDRSRASSAPRWCGGGGEACGSCPEQQLQTPALPLLPPPPHVPAGFAVTPPDVPRPATLQSPNRTE